MKLLKKFLEKINGLHYQQEYLCLAGGSFQKPLHAYLVHEGFVTKDITKQHLFVGYSPLLVAISSSEIPPGLSDISISFSEHDLSPGSNDNREDWVASLSLKKIRALDTSEGGVILFEG